VTVQRHDVRHAATLRHRLPAAGSRRPGPRRGPSGLERGHRPQAGGIGGLTLGGGFGWLTAKHGLDALRLVRELAGRNRADGGRHDRNAGAKYDRLARVEAAYDPDDRFHRNAGVRPARP
jgi:hypothetical protein